MEGPRNRPGIVLEATTSSGRNLTPKLLDVFMKFSDITRSMNHKCLLIIRDDARLEGAEPLVFLAHGFGVVRSSNLQKELSKMVEDKDYRPFSGAYESASPRSKLKQLGHIQQLETMIEKGPLSVVQAASELGLTPSQAKWRLDRLVSSGGAVKLGRVWARNVDQALRSRQRDTAVRRIVRRRNWKSVAELLHTGKQFSLKEIKNALS